MPPSLSETKKVVSSYTAESQSEVPTTNKQSSEYFEDEDEGYGSTE